MTDQEIIEVAAELSAKSLNLTRVCGFGPQAHTMMEDAGLIELARALISRAIPAGHVVVPKEPTVEMWEDGMNCYSPDDTQGDYLEKAYRAMIAAAPANKEG